MFVRLKRSKTSKHPTIQIVKGFRENGKVKQKVILSLGVIENQKDLIKLSKLAENLLSRVTKEGLPIEPKIALKDLVHKKTVYDGFGMVVDRLMEISEFNKVVKKAQGRNHFDLEEIVKLLIVQRLSAPSSKLRTYERQEEHGFQGIGLQHIYRAMDAIEPQQIDFQKQAFDTISKYLPESVKCFFFDVTTLYFESIEKDELRNFGFSKDQKTHMIQIVLALVVNSAGIPLAYELFQGNLSETKTLIPVLESLKSRFLVEQVIVVCDRGMASNANVLALQNAKFAFVIATKLRSMSKKLQITDLSKYLPLPDQDKFPEEEKVLFRIMEHPQYNNTTLIITYSPHRAQKDKHDREMLIDKLKSKLSSTDETSVKKLISNSGYKKYIEVQNGSSIKLDLSAIDLDAKWDGFHGIAVSKNADLTITEALSRYKDLWHVEEAFRVAKYTLKTRPIFHWTPGRIRSHILLCFITLFFERFLEFLLRKNNTPLTPDTIKYALNQVHTTIFEDMTTHNEGTMQSVLSEDVHKIFKVLGISTDRKTSLKPSCCA